MKYTIAIKQSTLLIFLSLSTLAINTGVQASDRKITEPFIISADNKAAVFSPYRFEDTKSIANTPTYRLYQIDYLDLKRHLSIYKKIYLTGQLLHGALMVKMKPKFVD